MLKRLMLFLLIMIGLCANTVNATKWVEKNTKLLQRIKQNDPTLSSLKLKNEDIDDDGAEALCDALKHNTVVTSLNLSGSKIGGTLVRLRAIANVLAHNSTLENLDLRATERGNAGATILAEGLEKNRGLKSLLLNGNRIGPEGGEALAYVVKMNATLKELSLGRNGIGSRGAQAIAEALSTNNTLVDLDLNDNQIVEPGSVVLAQALNTNQTLRRLNLTGNVIGVEACDAIYLALKLSNRTLVDLAITPSLPERKVKKMLEFVRRNRDSQKKGVSQIPDFAPLNDESDDGDSPKRVHGF